MKDEWIKVADRLPDDDRHILLWSVHKNNPLWNTYKIGSYIGKFYAVGGIESVEYITHWAELPPKIKVE